MFFLPFLNLDIFRCVTYGMEYSDKVVNMHWSSLFHNVFLNNIVKMFLLRQPNENIKFVSPFQIIQRARTDTWFPFNQKAERRWESRMGEKRTFLDESIKTKGLNTTPSLQREAFLFPEIGREVKARRFHSKNRLWQRNGKRALS